MATRKRKTKTKSILRGNSSKRYKTMNYLTQAQKAALRAMSAARGALAGRTAAASKQRAALRTGGYNRVEQRLYHT
jgi:hypothetical protein